MKALILIALAASLAAPQTPLPKPKPKAAEKAATPAPAAQQPAATPPAPAAEPAPNVLSIVPAQGEPEQVVTLSGSAFSDKTIVFMGNLRLPTKLIDQSQIEFAVPPVPPGLYALFLKNSETAASRPYSFTVLPRKPVLQSVSPERLTACTSVNQREITVSGRNFVEGSQILFDGAFLKTAFGSSESLSFQAPPVKGGVHQVQVRNPDDTTSGVAALIVDSRPEISRVYQGQDRVSSYDLIIEGLNFQLSSVLVVDGRRLAGESADRERAIFVDCNRIIYQRSPYDTSLKTIRLQVLNPGGEESQVAQVNAP